MSSAARNPSGPTSASLPEGLSARGVWLFEGHELDEPSRTLLTPEGESHALDRSAFLVLQYLLLHAGQLCSHDELLLAGWPRRRVQSNSLAKCISRLRNVLRDEAGERIRLTHGYGYLLAMPCSYRAGQTLLEPPPSLPKAGVEVPGRPDWTLLRHIGSGACGEVYAASHVAGLPPRAYKFADGEAGLRGLKRELALQHYLRLEHPALDVLLPVVDAQLTHAPYFLATPLQLQGNLVEWAEHDDQLRRLPRERRLALALALCEAVAGLHATGIAHRDLKPQNLYVLESSEGFRILLADLGAGAGTLPPGVEGTGVPIGQLTREGVLEAGSGPERYLAPELLAGSAATMQSDLYALGLLIYQIMVGDLHRTLAPGWEALLADPLLARDLAAAANQDPLARPATAGLLLERLQSLDARRSAEAEAARLDALSWELAQARVRARRRWQQLLAVVGIASVAILGLLVSTSQYLGARAAQREAERARELAEREARTSQAVLGFLNDTLLAQANPWSDGEGDPESKTLLRRAAQGIDQRFAGEPASAAAVHEAVAEAWEGWGEHALAMRHSRRALDLLGTLEAPMPATRAKLLRGLCRQARLGQQLDEAERACEAAASIERAIDGRVGPVLLVEQAKLRFEQGRCAETLALTASLSPPASAAPPPVWMREARWFRGICFGRLEDFSAARGEFDAVLDGPWDLSRRRDRMLRAWIDMDYAEALIGEGDFPAALRHVESAQQVFDALLGHSHPDLRLADYYRARIALWSETPAAAITPYQRVLEHWSRELGRDHLWTLYTETELLWAQAASGPPADAVPGLRQHLEAVRQRSLPVLEGRLPQRSFFAEAWAWTAWHLGDPALALAEVSRARADTLAALPAGHSRLATLACVEALALHQRGDRERAQAQLRTCSGGLSRFPADNHRQRWRRLATRQIGR